jgi:hypothetical protein
MTIELELVLKKIEEKSIVWFKNSNSYLVFEMEVAEILSKIDAKISLIEIRDWYSKKGQIPKEVILGFINDVSKIYTENNIPIAKEETNLDDIVSPTLFFSEKFYSIHKSVFKIQYETAYHESKIHPVFTHLEIEKSLDYNFKYTIFNNYRSIFFLKNNNCIGQWNIDKEIHLFKGKLSMQLLIDIYDKPEKDWMGTFHGSAVSNGKESLLFLGDSGSGKSTSLALLNANGFNCIADDFVPIDWNKDIYTYPAAISIKKKSVTTLLPYYPELENSAEYHFKKMNKIVRYLAPKKIDYNQKQKCKALIFIKYNPEIELEVDSISKIEAFQQLVPDSWISPLEENASIFLDWFLELPSYQLTYSNNEKMIETVSKIFSDDL